MVMLQNITIFYLKTPIALKTRIMDKKRCKGLIIKKKPSLRGVQSTPWQSSLTLSHSKAIYFNGYRRFELDCFVNALHFLAMTILSFYQ